VGERKKVVDDLTAKAVSAAGRNAARRALDDLVSSDEGRAERAVDSKRRRRKLIAYAIVGLLLVLGILGLVVSYWQWFILAGVVGLVGIYGWYLLRKRLRPKPDRKLLPAPKAQLPPAEPARDRALSADRQDVEAELAALKARLEK
jgi:Flp pilus assembly protein TadB